MQRKRYQFLISFDSIIPNKNTPFEDRRKFKLFNLLKNPTRAINVRNFDLLLHVVHLIFKKNLLFAFALAARLDLVEPLPQIIGHQIPQRQVANFRKIRILIDQFRELGDTQPTLPRLLLPPLLRPPLPLPFPLPLHPPSPQLDCISLRTEQVRLAVRNPGQKVGRVPHLALQSAGFGFQKFEDGLVPAEVHLLATDSGHACRELQRGLRWGEQLFLAH